MTRPLTVALTQSGGRLKGLAGRLREAGMDVIRRPLIETRAAGRPEPATREQLAACPWLLFASPAVVRAWKYWGLGFNAHKIGATGPGTARLLEQLGARVEVIGAPADATGLAREFLTRPDAGGPVALPRGDRALPILPNLLNAAGIETRLVTAYHTVTKPWRPRNLPDAIVIASPSALDALSAEAINHSALVAIGGTTARAALKQGANVTIATEPTVEGVWQACLKLQAELASGVQS